METCFAGQQHTDDLAEVLLDRIKLGEVNIVIACDRLPSGTARTVASVSSHRALGFTCDIVEIVPFVQKELPDADILFVPSVRLSTEIVARTAVTVTYEAGQTQPSTKVEVTSVEEIERNVKTAEKRAGSGRMQKSSQPFANRVSPSRLIYWICVES